jgi:hypothetical protein
MEPRTSWKHEKDYISRAGFHRLSSSRRLWYAPEYCFQASGMSLWTAAE